MNNILKNKNGKYSLPKVAYAMLLLDKSGIDVISKYPKTYEKVIYMENDDFKKVLKKVYWSNHDRPCNT